jgi:ribosome-associated heat shock protein Hsp15
LTPGPPVLERQRVDKWLWHARMVRTRSDAAALAEAGYVRLNGKRIGGPSQPVRLGDVVTLALDRSVRVLRVESFCERRRGAPLARALYRELTTGSGARASTSGADSRKVAPPKTEAD